MTRRILLAIALGLAGLLAGCGDSTPALGARLFGPTDVVPFRGITVNSPDLRQYLAVAAGRGNELRIVDLTNDDAVLGPSVVFPLSIPSEPRPVRLASASLADGGADLLVASSAGSGVIELVVTWNAQNRIIDSFDLAEAVPGAAPDVLALTAAPVLDAGGAPVPGQARIVAALSGGRLAVITAIRDVDGQSIQLVRPALVRDVGFTAVDLAVVESAAPGTEGFWLFAATADDLDPSPEAEVFGVAQIDLAADPASWTAIPLDARAPTLLVAAAEVAERIPTDQRTDTFQAESPLRVYAALDPSGCGLARPINCGLVTLEPVTRTGLGGSLAPDPVGELDHRAPMPINGVPLDLAISEQPAAPAAGVCPDQSQARLLIAPGTGQRCTSAVAAVSSSDGFVYVYDLGRWGAPNEVSLVRSTTRVRVSNVTGVRPAVDPATDTAPILALWDGDGEDARLTLSQPNVMVWFRVTPGYTPTERFHIGWKAPLPAFVSRGAVLGRLPDGRVYIAAQVEAGRDAQDRPVWALGPRLSDPANGVRPGDTIAFATTVTTTCAPVDGVFPQTTVAEVLEPDPLLFPGGAVALGPLSDGTGLPLPACVDAAIAENASGLAPISFTLRAQEHVLFGDVLGYLGRPEKDVRFNLAWQDESNPALTPEQRAVARKLRRFYYPGADRCDAAAPCTDLGTTDPLTPGPVLSFRLGWFTDAQRTGPEPLAGEQLLVDTQSGISPMARKPVASGALPLGIARVDRSTFIAPGDVVRFYVAYQDDQVFVFSPGQSLTQDFSIR